MYELRGTDAKVSWDEDPTTGELLDPIARQWEEEWNVLRIKAGLGRVFTSDAMLAKSAGTK